MTTEAFGVPVPELPEGYVALEAVVLLECLDDDGTMRLVVRYSEGLSVWRAIGMLDVALATERASVVAGFESG